MTCLQADRQSSRHSDSQTGRFADMKAYIFDEKHEGRQVDFLTYRQEDRKICKLHKGRHNDLQTCGQAGRQIC